LDYVLYDGFTLIPGDIVNSFSAIFAGLLGLLQGASPEREAVAPADPGETRSRHAPTRRQRMLDWQSLASLPDDPALPALTAIAKSGVRAALSFLDLGSGDVQLSMRGYSKGKRMTLELRSADRRMALKAHSTHPDLEVELYTALAGGTAGVHVPHLLGWDRDLRVFALEWLEGPTLLALIHRGEGKRAGEFAATWLRAAAAMPVRFGPHHGARSLLAKASKWADHLGAADESLGKVASSVARRLAATQPVERAIRLVHGSLYDRHILDLGDGPGLIDWDCFGQGSAELDAAVFLSVVWRSGLQPERQRAAAEATAAFRARTAGLLDDSALAWHQAVMMLRLAHKKIRRAGDSAVTAARPFLDEAARLAG